MMKLRRAIAVTAACFILLAGGARAADSYAGSEACAACHPSEYDQWKNSIHARAFSGAFQAVWKKLGAKAECLACHTTGHKAGTKEHAFPGVTCESCHGPLKEGHPGEAKMILPVDSEICNKCHAHTYREWKLSPHGQKNIRCFDCHSVHAQGLRARGSENLCGSCHPGRLKSFAHTTHHEQGLTCLTCHFPSPQQNEERIEGTGAAPHTLSVGAEICARCHREMVHRSHRLTTLRGEVSALQEVLKHSQAEDVAKLREEAEHLKFQLQRSRQFLYWLLFVALLAGVVVGMVFYARFARRGRSE